MLLGRQKREISCFCGTKSKTSLAFYIDFIVRSKNGNIGLLDTKSGFTITEAAGEKGKSDGLQKYIKKYPKLFGGITANRNRDFSGNWMYFKGKGRDLVKNDFTNWDLLQF